MSITDYATGRQLRANLARTVSDEAHNMAKQYKYLFACEVFTGKELKDVKSDAKYDTEIQVLNKDTFDVLADLLTEGLFPVGLNMASDYKPGGGWWNGSIAQEESLFYRSTYCVS